MLQHNNSRHIVRFVPTVPITNALASTSPGEKELYDFQVDCVNQVYSHIQANIQRILLVAACATGKTTMASQIIKDATQVASLPTRCLFLVSLNCLINQAVETLEEFGIISSVLQGSRQFEKSATVVVASIQTIRSRLKKQELGELLGSFGVVFADEAHVLC
jgi:superfamily II DNA or RNA helicase